MLSGKDAMDEPVRFAVAAMKTRPEQPEAPPLLVLDTVIVADRVNVAGAARLPPFIGNPLRSIGTCHAMPAAPPNEVKRRVVRQQPECLDRLRRLEQTGIDRIEPLLEERYEVTRIAAGTGGAELDP